MKHVISIRCSLPEKYSKNAIQREFNNFVKDRNKNILLPAANLIKMKIYDNEIVRALSGAADVVVYFALSYRNKIDEKDALERFEEDMKDWREGQGFGAPASYKDLLYTNLLHELSDHFREYAKTMKLKYLTTTYYVL